MRVESTEVDLGNSREVSPERVREESNVVGGEIAPEEERPRVNAAGVVSDHEVFVPSVAIRRSRMPTGLLDGGATHALRAAREGEWDQATPTRVALAVGSQDLRISAVGTVLSQDAIAPIAPFGLLVDLLGCRVQWSIPFGGSCESGWRITVLWSRSRIAWT